MRYSCCAVGEYLPWTWAVLLAHCGHARLALFPATPRAAARTFLHSVPSLSSCTFPPSSSNSINRLYRQHCFGCFALACSSDCATWQWRWCLDQVSGACFVSLTILQCDLTWATLLVRYQAPFDRQSESLTLERTPYAPQKVDAYARSGSWKEGTAWRIFINSTAPYSTKQTCHNAIRTYICLYDLVARGDGSRGPTCQKCR